MEESAIMINSQGKLTLNTTFLEKYDIKSDLHNYEIKGLKQYGDVTFFITHQDA